MWTFSPATCLLARRLSETECVELLPERPTKTKTDNVTEDKGVVAEEGPWEGEEQVDPGRLVFPDPLGTPVPPVLLCPLLHHEFKGL